MAIPTSLNSFVCQNLTDRLIRLKLLCTLRPVTVVQNSPNELLFADMASCVCETLLPRDSLMCNTCRGHSMSLGLCATKLPVAWEERTDHPLVPATGQAPVLTRFQKPGPKAGKIRARVARAVLCLACVRLLWQAWRACRACRVCRVRVGHEAAGQIPHGRTATTLVGTIGAGSKLLVSLYSGQYRQTACLSRRIFTQQ